MAAVKSIAKIHAVSVAIQEKNKVGWTERGRGVKKEIELINRYRRVIQRKQDRIEGRKHVCGMIWRRGGQGFKK